MNIQEKLAALIKFVKKNGSDTAIATLQQFCVKNFNYDLPVDKPLPPTEFRAWWKGNNDTGLDWKNSVNAKGYIVDFSADQGVTWKQIAKFEGDGRYVRHNPSPFGINQYRIKAFNGAGESDYAPVLTFEMKKDNGKITPVVVPPVNIVANFTSETEVPFFIKADEIQSEDSRIPTKTDWVVTGPDGKVLLETEGFNIAILPTVAGDYKIKVANQNASKEYILRVTEKKWNVITDPADLSAAIKASKSDTKIVLTKEATLTTLEKFNGRLVANGNTINYSGPTYTPNKDNTGGWPTVAFTLAKGATLDGINFTGPFYDGSQRYKVIKFAEVAGNNYISNCKISKVSFGINLESSPSNIGFVGNKFDRYLANYVVWMGGSGLFIYDNTAEDSSTEHIVRGAGYSWVTIANNKFRNQDLRNATDDTKEPWNYSKSCINCQWGKLVYVYNNTAREGAISVGPLGGGDGDKTGSQWTRYAVVRNNTLINETGSTMAEFQVQHGTEYLKFENNTGAKTSLRLSDPQYPTGHLVLNSEITIDKASGYWNWDAKALPESTKITIK